MNISKNSKCLKPLIALGEWMGEKHPKTFARIRYFIRFRKFLHLSHPRDLNEKILYLSLCTDTTEWTRLADKYRVREYVHQKGLDDILVKLYGVWEKADDCDFSMLPDKFVMKCNHGSGQIIIVKNKKSIDLPTVRAEFQKELSKPYGAIECGLHYMRIKPRLIAEELLENDDVSGCYSSSLIDYKIWCFNGKPSFVLVCCNRSRYGCEMVTYDMDWNPHPEYLVENSHYLRGKLIPRPANFSRMVEIAQQLAEGFPVIRVDLYNINGKIYLGELTFTSLGGMMNYYTPEFLKMSGDMVSIPQ